MSEQTVAASDDLVAWAGPELETWAVRHAQVVRGLMRLGWTSETLLMVGDEVARSRGVRNIYTEMALWAQTMGTLPSEWAGLLPVSILIRSGIRRREVLPMVWRFYRDRLAGDPEAGDWTTPQQVIDWHRVAVADFMVPLGTLAGLTALDQQARETAAWVISSTRLPSHQVIPDDYPQD